MKAVMREGIDHVERRLRARLLALPDGVWREVQFLDHDGHRPNARVGLHGHQAREKLTHRLHGNHPRWRIRELAYGGLRAATLSAVCIMLGYDLTWNDGVARCVDIRPRKTAVSAEYPTPVSMATISAIIVT